MGRTLLAAVAALMTLHSLTAAQTRFGTDVSVGAAIPMGTFAPIFSTGPEVSVAFSMGSEPNVAYHLLLGWSRMTLDAEALTASGDFNPYGGVYTGEGSVNVYPLLIGVRFYPDQSGARPYGVLEAGVFMYSKSFDGGTYTDPTGDVSNLSSTSSFRAEPGFNAGIGVLIPVAEDKSLDLAFRYHLVKDSQYYNFTPTGSTAAYVGFSQYVGLTVGLDFSY
jgi:hypothetical protein